MKELKLVHQRLKNCRKCTTVCGPPVHGPAFKTKLMLVGQAPGVHEGVLGRPFAYTAGKTLFKWLKESLGSEESEIREMLYFTAIARCFPGKSKSGKGDRVPSKKEIENCSEFIKAEMALVKPEIILAVGKVAMLEVLKDANVTSATPLEDLVGKIFEVTFHGRKVKVVPLPHPSGVSPWPHTEIGKKKLNEALNLLSVLVSKTI